MEDMKCCEEMKPVNIGLLSAKWVCKSCDTDLEEGTVRGEFKPIKPINSSSSDYTFGKSDSPNKTTTLDNPTADEIPSHYYGYGYNHDYVDYAPNWDHKNLPKESQNTFKDDYADAVSLVNYLFLKGSD